MAPEKSFYHRDKFFKHLTELRDGFSDEIPTEVLHSISPNNRFKVRRLWFQDVVADIEYIMMHNDVTSPDVKEKAEKFIKHVTSHEFHQQPLTSKADIEEANEVIDLILGR